MHIACKLIYHKFNLPVNKPYRSAQSDLTATQSAYLSNIARYHELNVMCQAKTVHMTIADSVALDQCASMQSDLRVTISANM